MARVDLIDPRGSDDPEIQGICDWVTEMEGEVPNHFLIEMNFPEFFKAKLGATKVLWQMGELSLEEIQHVGIAVSKANSCSYCTAAFCTIMNYGMETDEDYTKSFLANGVEVILDDRLKTIVSFALRVNKEMHDITDAEIDGLRQVGLTDKGIVQLVNLVSDFASYNRLNLALRTDYDYRDMWRQVGFDWTLKEGEQEGDNTRGVRK
ncbi:carboxymuconolactone decarboxylase family protein [Emcibacter nanhaiensis]|uniref:Carboxymuconolactone decarboxylase family protein n=1 Tax=Emcibacter nanhaiensis TaxID=1505037 RepID=A0A501PGA3_9PROT|nr:carboxymuconolactone decarboxylase family protein [Emcibacter nanhaiensis]TPD59032.1 carboxymuconolactone decarboxylase family protein [Emcibacter nanhaiensis]